MWTPLFADAHYGIHAAGVGYADDDHWSRCSSRSRSGTIIAIYLSEFAPFTVSAKPSSRFSNCSAAVPTVVYGYFALLYGHAGCCR